MAYSLLFKVNNEPWNKGMIIGPKPPLKLKEVWAIRIRLQLSGDVRNLALFNLAIDSKLRACDLISIRVNDVTQGYKVVQRATVMQKKTKRPDQFEISDQTRLAIRNLITQFDLTPSQFLFPSRMSSSPHISTRQYAKIVKDWVADIGLDTYAYGTHSLRRTKATLIYRRTKNLRAVQLLDHLNDP
jgi:integrase